VWQYQNVGARYATDALYAQLTVPETYSWRAELGRELVLWRDFNREAQAQLLEDVWAEGSDASSVGVFYKDDPVGADVRFVVDDVDHTSLALESVAYVRSAWSARPSALL
jgi:hypothetical protein